MHIAVATIMTADPVVLRPSDRAERAAREMALSRIHHVPVVDQRGVLVGLISRRHLLEARCAGRTVGELMTSDVKTVTADTAAWEAAYLLLHHRIGCVPVTDAGGALVGIVTHADFVRAAYALLGGPAPVDQLELEEQEAQRV
jgi:CBS domain-containing membrane protein